MAAKATVLRQTAEKTAAAATARNIACLVAIVAPWSAFAISPFWNTNITNSGKNVHIGEATCARQNLKWPAPPLTIAPRLRLLEFTCLFNRLLQGAIEDGLTIYAAAFA